MKKVFVTRLIGLLVLLTNCLPVGAQMFESDGIYYVILGDNVYIDHVDRNSQGDMIIPNEVMYNGKSYSVTIIVEDAFSGCSKLTSITLPPSLTLVSDHAFNGCNGLKAVYISDLEAFFKIDFEVCDCSNPFSCNPLYYAGHLFLNGEEIKDLVIPNNITGVHDGACVGWYALNSLKIPNSVTFIGYYAFYGCSGLTTITSEIEKPFAIGSSTFSDDTYNNAELIVPKGTKAAYQATEGWNKFAKITESAYGNTFTEKGIYYKSKSDGTLEVTGLASWTTRADIPSSLTVNGTKYKVTSIGDYAFEGRSDITYLSLQYSIKSIGKYAFRDCGNSMTVNIANLDSWCNMELGNEHSSPLSSAGKVLLYDVETTSINIPETVTSIGKYTFYQCRSITSLSIPSSVTSIGSSAFEDCTGLTSVTLSKGLTSIGGSSFEGCKSLTSITIPSTVTSIALNAFKDCSSLNNITSEIQQPFAIEDNVFSTYATATLKVPAGTKSAYQSTTGWNKFAKITEKSSGVDNPDYPNQYLTFVARERGSFSFNGTSYNNVDNSVIYYSLDNGYSWTPLLRNVQSPTIQAGNMIMFKGTLTPLYYDVNDGEAIVGIGGFSSTGRFDVEGNIMSLLFGDNFIGKTNLTGKDHAFFELFLDCTGLSSACNLVLPATTLADNCYEGMFRNCTSMTIAPQLPATKLPKCCYEGMFYNCTSLTTVPQLQATSLGISCYSHMFGFCTSLTIAPKLPAVALEEKCYRSMFRGCMSLTKAPQLPATTLTSQCYEYMFAGCTNLTEITCLATNFSASDCTGNWLSDVASTGTFTKSSSMNSWTRGANGIPTNWTVKNDNGSSINEFTINSISYVVDNSALTAEVKAVDNSLKSVKIPESINCNGIEYRVTSLAERSFEGRDDITYLSIPSSITSIGEYAFLDCGSNIMVNIESLEAWCKVKFGNQHSSPLSSAKAFYLNDVEVKSLSIPNGVTSISSYAFFQCRSVTSLFIPSTVTSISSSVFEDCTGLTSVTLSKGLALIGGSSFEGCKGLTSITIPSTVTLIALNAFKDCSSLNVITSEIQQPFAIEENVFSTYATATLKVPAGTKSAYQSTAGWYMFKTITEEQAEKDDVVFFELGGIYYYGSGDEVMVTSGLQRYEGNIAIPSQVTYDGKTYSVTYIDPGAFSDSDDLLSIAFPNSLRSIGERTFRRCSSLTTIISEIEKPFVINSNTFSDDTYTTVELIVPKGTKTLYQATEGWNKFARITETADNDEVAFTIDGIGYQGSKAEKNVVVNSVDTSKTWLEIPASVSYDGVTYQVTGIDNDVFKGSSMAALIWNVEAALPNNAFSNASIGSNFLLFVKQTSFAPSSIKNVIANGTASSIVLSDDGGAFYCPQAFTARSISYIHNYSMETGGNGKGWETIALPFDVQRIVHSTRGEIIPFAGYRSGSNQKPFWLANMSASGFKRASSILSYEPYIIAMPNSSNYRNEYNLAGDVTFSAENVQVAKTPAFNGLFLPAFGTVPQSSTVYALNVSNRNVRYSGNYDAGSHFIANLRDVRPFEAYMTGSSSTRGIYEITFDDGATDMLDILLPTDEGQEVTIYTLSGQQVARTTQRDFDIVWQQLPKGVYIINGKKMIK